MMLTGSRFFRDAFVRSTIGAVVVAPLFVSPVFVTLASAAPKLDKDTCAQFKTEQIKFIQSGILADLQRGPEWGKTNLSADRLREIELFITLDEQIKFACREATLTPNLVKVEEIAKRLEMNPNIDPFAPLPQPDQPKAADAKPAGAATATKPKPAVPKPKPQAAKKPAEDAYTGPPIMIFEAPPAAKQGASGSP